MGLLVDGVWHDQWYDTSASGGRFVRSTAKFRNWVTADGSPGPSGEGGFKAEPGRYHLYVSLACPWAHRTLIFRSLKKLEDAIGVSVVEPHMLENGWEFSERHPDHLFGSPHLYDVYLRALPDMTGRVTVPVLWDKERGTIVSNESSEIIRMLNSAFDAFGDASLDFYPEELRTGIEEINLVIYDTVNNGVYKAGFATTQEAYEEAYRGLFSTLDMLEQRLSKGRFLMGERLTEADWRLFTTLLRFDPVYFGHFKCNRQQIADFPNLSNYLRDLYQVPGVAETVSIEHIKQHYYYSHATINPTRIVPLGPEMHLDAPHDRDRFRGEGIPRPIAA
ncbi:putative glutathione S-transferase [Faunimonas pinastri]|uniref:Putative glutathione S-transferase n=1 Tax=Faunimonas pinastri TaxID=1855383 RepID=A0A1H9ADM7_9HYPH|nr:glutathione S-transferase family protein [Faunimonas pinastri]SEP74533.1 putative glutathione S-transferase [Faunimonas pinastri]